jgi:catechol 2,3-dioxygenase-like lactoylglutathione lyase family enzyme
VWLDHISFVCANYKENVAFYTALLGWKPGDDEGSQNECEIGNVGGIIIRGGNPAGGPITPQINVINHIAFGVTPFDPDAVKAELDKRGLGARADTGDHGDIHVAPYKSYHTPTPNGFDLQISNVDFRTRTTR